MTPSVNLSHLRVFGCAAWVTFPISKRDGKLLPNSIYGVMVGYDSNRKAYKIYHPPTNKTYCSKDVRFAENVFPMANSPESHEVYDHVLAPLSGIPAYPKGSSPLTSISPFDGPDTLSPNDNWSYSPSFFDESVVDPPNESLPSQILRDIPLSDPSDSPVPDSDGDIEMSLNPTNLSSDPSSTTSNTELVPSTSSANQSVSQTLSSTTGSTHSEYVPPKTLIPAERSTIQTRAHSSQSSTTRALPAPSLTDVPRLTDGSHVDPLSESTSQNALTQTTQGPMVIDSSHTTSSVVVPVSPSDTSSSPASSDTSSSPVPSNIIEIERLRQELAFQQQQHDFEIYKHEEILKLEKRKYQDLVDKQTNERSLQEDQTKLEVERQTFQAEQELTAKFSERQLQLLRDNKQSILDIYDRKLQLQQEASNAINHIENKTSQATKELQDKSTEVARQKHVSMQEVNDKLAAVTQDFVTGQVILAKGATDALQRVSAAQSAPGPPSLTVVQPTMPIYTMNISSKPYSRYATSPVIETPGSSPATSTSMGSSSDVNILPTVPPPRLLPPIAGNVSNVVPSSSPPPSTALVPHGGKHFSTPIPSPVSKRISYEVSISLSTDGFFGDLDENEAYSVGDSPIPIYGISSSVVPFGDTTDHVEIEGPQVLE